MTRLSVNVNKVAHLRNTRHLNIPGVLRAARVSLDAGAGGITVHPRPDERHIRGQDVYDLAGMLKEEYPGVELNIEGNPFEGSYLTFVREVRPAQCTLVPDSPTAFTSDQGWQPQNDGPRLKPVIAELRSLGCRVSLFMDADSRAISEAVGLGADAIELYTEPYAAAFETSRRLSVLEEFQVAARVAQEAGFQINAGHDLNLENLGPLLEAIPAISEVSIGHALIAEAIFRGLGPTVQAYLRVIEDVRA